MVQSPIRGKCVFMIVTITLGSQTGTQGSVRGWSGGPLVMKLDSSLPHTHTYTYAHVGIGQLKGSKGTEHCDYDRLAMKN